MGAITPTFLSGVENRITKISTNEYNRLNDNVWWPKIMRRMPSVTKLERVLWLIDTAQIERPNASRTGGQAVFADIVSKTTEYESLHALSGLELLEAQLADVANGIQGGEGLQLAAHWARQAGALSAYWPQQELARVLQDPATVTYDALTFFNAAHLSNPFDTASDTFANLITGKPIDVSVTVDVALANLTSVIAQIAGIKMPNGTAPRGLRVRDFFHPPALASRAQQLTNAKFIAQAASSGGGGADVAAVVTNMGLATPVQCDEFGAGFDNGSDTTYYLGAESIATDELGAFAWVDREPFSIRMHGPMTNAQLSRMDKFEWKLKGRNVVGPGHPYLLFKVTAA